MPANTHRKRLFKGMNLEVATRNPDRLEGFLATFSKYEGKVMNDETILDIFAQFYLDGVLKGKFENVPLDEKHLNKEYLKERISIEKSHNGELGYPTGFQGAFVRYLKTLFEFGFVYAPYNQELRISDVGKAVLEHKISLSEAFALQVIRHWRKNPYKRVKNDYNFFTFIFDILKKRGRLSYNQFVVASFSDDGDVDEFIKLIDDNPIGANKEAAYQLIVDNYSLIDEDHDKVNDITTVFSDYMDVVFRVLQITGFVSIDYDGVNMIYLNKNREELLDKLMSLDFSLNEDEKEDWALYFNKLGSLDSSLLKIIVKNREKQDFSTVGYNAKIPAILSSFKMDKEKLGLYLKEICSNTADRRAFKFVPAPVKFELVLTLFLYACYGDRYSYKPNFKCDDKGIPYDHAPGYVGDIEIKDDNLYLLVEATLIQNKKQQVNSETLNLIRHVDSKGALKSFLCLVAPHIHDDTELLLKAGSLIHLIELGTTNFYSKPYDINEFVDTNNSGNIFADIENYSTDVLKSIKVIFENAGI